MKKKDKYFSTEDNFLCLGYYRWLVIWFIPEL